MEDNAIIPERKLSRSKMIFSVSRFRRRSGTAKIQSVKGLRVEICVANTTRPLTVWMVGTDNGFSLFVIAVCSIIYFYFCLLNPTATYCCLTFIKHLDTVRVDLLRGEKKCQP